MKDRPMGRIIRFTPDRHAHARSLLPWYVTGQLDEAERARVEAHLRGCPECQAELRVERELASAVAELPFESDNGWAAMRRLIDRQERPAGRLARLRDWFAWRPQAGGALALPGVAGWAIAAQLFLAAAALALAVPLSRAPAYHALGAVRPAPVGDVIVIFKPDASAEALTRALRDSGTRLVDGPTEADAYVLETPAGKRAAALGRLRADAAVSLAEPIDPAGRP
jgi:anti-sigma factor RsiW